MSEPWEKDSGKRWEDGDDHHPKSKELFDFLADRDFDEGDSFGWKSGGDGDNGESLMYQMDAFFEKADAEKPLRYYHAIYEWMRVDNSGTSIREYTHDRHPFAARAELVEKGAFGGAFPLIRFWAEISREEYELFGRLSTARGDKP